MNPYRVYLILGGASAIFLNMIYVVIAIYYVQDVGMNPLQLVLVGTVLEITAFLFEVPTGIVADVYSRRLSVILGELLIGVCFVIEGIVPTFVAILVAEIIRGVGGTFISGALSAWIADEVGETDLGRMFMRYNQVRQGGAFVGTIFGVALASVKLSFAVMAGGLLMVFLSIFLVFTMPEQGFRPTARQQDTLWQTMSTTLRASVAAVRASQVVFLLIVVSLVVGAYTEGFDRLWEAHMLANVAFPLVGTVSIVLWFGAITVAIKLVNLVVAEAMLRRFDLDNILTVGRVLRRTTLVMVVGIIVFGMTSHFVVAVGALLVVELFRNVQEPLRETWLNKTITTRTRATILSMSSQADALGQVVGGPIIGLVGTLASLRAAMLLNALLFLPALALYRRATAHNLAAATRQEDEAF